MATTTVNVPVTFKAWNTNMKFQPWTAMLKIGDGPHAQTLFGMGNTKYEAFADLLKTIEHEQEQRDNQRIKERLEQHSDHPRD